MAKRGNLVASLRVASILTLVLIFFGSVSLIAAPGGAAAAEKTWELKMHHHAGPTFSKLGLEGWAKKVEEATKGRVKIKVFPFSALGGVTEGYDLVTSGTADVAWTFTGFFPGQFLMTNLMTLPFVTCSTATQTSELLWDFTEKFPKVFAKEYEEVKLLILHTCDANIVGTTKKPVHTLEDMKGLNMRAGAGPLSDYVKALGANPQIFNVADAYLAFEKGVIDGFVSDWSVVDAFKWYEVINYYTTIGVNTNCYWIVMNKDVWNSMPPDVQAQIMSVSGKAGATFIGNVWDEITRNTIERISKMPGKTIIPVSEEEKARWRKLARPIWDSYVEKLEAKGLPAKEGLEYLLKEVAQCK